MMTSAFTQRAIVRLTFVACAWLCFALIPLCPPTLAAAGGGALPRMVDLGRNQCTPCKMMAPILEELKREYAGTIDIEFIDVSKNPDAMEKLGLPLRAVPFQAFYDASGKIVKRHYGYMSKEEIVKAFRELGFDRKAPRAAAR